MVGGQPDSIYNGARDNAVGIAAILNAARYFAQHPPKRSVLFIAYGGEEGGMLGSKHFAQNPPLPLKQLVYNLNIDNAGYNDTTVVTVVGLGRTSADEHLKKAAAAFGLSAIADPAPEQNLFDRSDNVSLAVKGVPAPTFSLGFRKFDEEISKYYHQVTDETATLSMPYVLKYIKSFVLAAKYIADDKEQPKWIKGDKYEAAGSAQYQ
jgi:Zn-dependent M28 family amino/carboxypeptidase